MVGSAGNALDWPRKRGSRGLTIGALYRQAGPLSRPMRQLNRSIDRTRDRVMTRYPLSPFSASSRAALGCALSALVVAPAFGAAQESPAAPPSAAPAPAGVPTGIQGPPNGLVTPGPPLRRPPPVDLPVLPAPAPAPAPPPAPAPVPQAIRPTAIPTAGHAAPRRVAPANVPRAAPAFPPRAAAATPPAEVLPPVVPSEPLDSATDTTAQTAPIAASAPAVGLPRWWPLAAGGAAALIVLIAGVWLGRRRRPLALPAPVPHDQVPAVPAPSAAAVMPAPLPSVGPVRARLSIVFEPLGAQSTLFNLRLRYAVTVRNDGDAEARNVGVRFGLFTGAQTDERALADWFAQPVASPPHHAVERIDVGSGFRFEGEISAALDAINALVVDGREMVIPVIAIDARYDLGVGEGVSVGQSGHSYVVGRDPGPVGARLAPFRLDRGPADFAPLGQRDLGVGCTI